MGYVYIISISDSANKKYYKIGKTCHFTKYRISRIQTSCPFKITLYAVAVTDHFNELEKLLHREFLAFKVFNEWFNLGLNELSKLDEIIKAANEGTLYA